MEEARRVVGAIVNTPLRSIPVILAEVRFGSRLSSNRAVECKPFLCRGCGLPGAVSSNRAVECKPFLVSRLWFAGSSVVFAVETVSPHDGASREEPSKV